MDIDLTIDDVHKTLNGTINNYMHPIKVAPSCRKDCCPLTKVYNGIKAHIRNLLIGEPDAVSIAEFELKEEFTIHHVREAQNMFGAASLKWHVFPSQNPNNTEKVLLVEFD